MMRSIAAPDDNAKSVDGAGAAIARAHEWFHHNSGWAPPDPDTLADWLAEGICRAPDDCLTTPDGWCRHGLASWQLILLDLD
jgi:hypothetical protein